jgi:hypothetical protein
MSRRLDEFLAESQRLEALTGRRLDSLQSRAEKLEREVRSISPSSLLASDIMQMPPATLEEFGHELPRGVLPFRD